MKLKLEYLAGYLPYQLKAQDIRTKEIRTVTLLHFTYDDKTVGHNHLIYDGLLLSKHLPILRPLSDLTKEIEVNGEKFAPLYVLQRLDKLFISDFIQVFGIEECKFSVIEKLLEWHFDIYGLIDKGLAIDINTL